MEAPKRFLALWIVAIAGFAQATTFDTTLHTFAGGNADGASPQGSLTLFNSTLYGMTEFGGSGNVGTLFKVNLDGTGFNLLHTFLGGPSDGKFPLGTLTLSGSTIFGMTVNGGSGPGTLFQINTDGTGFQVLHPFSGGNTDGRNPVGAVLASGATLYGMTQQGGSASDRGTLFKINNNGTGFGLLHTFGTDANDGQGPRGTLTQVGSTLFGMTQYGGTYSKGTIFKVNTDGTGYSILHNLTQSGSEGGNPNGSLTLAGGVLFGTTASGGANGGSGTIFQINTDGTGFQTLHTFQGSRGGATGDAADGAEPDGSLTLSGSTLIGTSRQGGAYGKGAIFELNTDGTGFTLLDSLGGTGSAGTFPIGDVVLSGTTLFGLTPEGGTSGSGVIYSVAVPEPSGGALLLLGGAGLALALRMRGRHLLHGS